MTELIRFLMVRSCVMTRTMHAWRKANAYVRSGQHDRAIYWLSRTQAILDAGPPCRSRLKDVDAGYMHRSRMLLKVMKGRRGGHYPLGHLRRGGHYPLGHLRRGVIIPWVNLSVTGNGGTLPKVIPEGAPHCQHLATPLKDAVEGDEGGLVVLRQ